MKKFVLLTMMLVVLPVSSATSADWRWAEPKLKLKRVKPVCETYQCHVSAKVQAKYLYKARVKYYHAKKLAEWKAWTRIPIPDCTWYGESGHGPKYAKVRYTMPNSMGSGAFGKYQMMPGTYSANAKYGDRSPLDQEIAARREYWKHGIFPWTNCTS